MCVKQLREFKCPPNRFERNSFVKALLLSSLATGLALKAASQGTIEFANFHTGAPLNAPVYEADGLTRLSGSQFVAQLLAGPSATDLGSVGTTSFLIGNRAGYFYGGVLMVDSVNPGSAAWVQVDVWNTSSGASFVQAQASGQPNSWWQSSVFSVITGRSSVNPTPPAVLTGLGTSPVFLNGAAVPEPSTIALGLAGAIVALLRLRRPSVTQRLAAEVKFGNSAMKCLND